MNDMTERLDNGVYQASGHFEAVGYRHQYFFFNADTMLAAETGLYNLIDDYAKEVGCESYIVLSDAEYNS